MHHDNFQSKNCSKTKTSCFFLTFRNKVIFRSFIPFFFLTVLRIYEHISSNPSYFKNWNLANHGWFFFFKSNMKKNLEFLILNFHNTEKYQTQQSYVAVPLLVKGDRTSKNGLYGGYKINKMGRLPKKGVIVKRGGLGDFWKENHQKINKKIKVARVVSLKSAFTDWFFLQFYNTNKVKQNPIPKDEALLFPRNQVICLQNWKLWRAPTVTEFNIFCWNFANVSFLMSTKMCWEFFLILFRTWIINKNVKNDCAKTGVSKFLQITQDLNRKIKWKIMNILL